MPKFQRRHYQVIADLLSADTPNLFEREDRERIILAFSRAFESDNANFKTDRFLHACGVRGKD